MNLFTGSIFAIILFSTVMWFGSQAWASLSFVPPGWGANSSQNCHSCSFCSHKQRCWTVLSELWYEVASYLNTFFLSWRQRTAAVFFKNVTNFTVIWVKRRPKAGSVDLCWARPDTADISSKITPRQQKQRRKRKSEEEERRRREKKQWLYS